jgi:hypothetical protein
MNYLFRYIVYMGIGCTIAVSSLHPMHVQTEKIVQTIVGIPITSLGLGLLIWSCSLMKIQRLFNRDHSISPHNQQFCDTAATRNILVGSLLILSGGIFLIVDGIQNLK